MAFWYTASKYLQWRQVRVEMKLKIMAIITVAIALILSFSTPAIAMADLSRLNKIENVSLVETKKGTTIRVDFRKEIDKKPDIRFYEKSVQLEFDKAYVTPAKQDLGFKTGFAKTGALYQLSKDKVRLRFFTSKDGREFEKRVTAQTVGKTLYLSIKPAGKLIEPATALPRPEPAEDKRKPYAFIEEIKTSAPQKKQGATATAIRKQIPKDVADDLSIPFSVKEEKQTKPVAEKTIGTKNKILDFLAPPAKAAEKEITATKSGSKGSAKVKGFLDYKEPKAPKAPSMTSALIKMVTALATVLGILFVLAYFAKKYQSKIGSAFGNSTCVTILATSAIGVKKQITVVDVAGEVLVLGVSGDNITMLKTIDDQDTADYLRKLKGGKTGKGGGSSLMANVGGGNISTKAQANQKESGAWGTLLKNGLSNLLVGAGKNKNVTPAPALLDEKDIDTFAGRLAKMAEEEPTRYTPRGKGIETKDEKRKLDRKTELLKSITSAIRSQNVEYGTA